MERLIRSDRDEFSVQSNGDKSPTDAERCSLVVSQRRGKKKKGVLVLMHPGGKATHIWAQMSSVTEGCYTACIRVPQYLCHKSMALVTMASVFSCGMLRRNPTTPSGRLMPVKMIL